MSLVKVALMFFLMGLSACQKSVTRFEVFPFPAGSTVESNDWDLLGKVLVSTSAQGGFSLAGNRLVLIQIQAKDGKVIHEQSVAYQDKVFVEASAQWVSQKKAKFIVIIEARSNPNTSKTALEITLD